MLMAAEPPSAHRFDVERLREQELPTFHRLIELHQELVLSLCYAAGLRGVDAHDAVADVFCAVYFALPGFKGDSRVSTWIYRIAVRTIRRQARGQKPESSALEHVLQNQAGNLPDTFDVLWNQERSELIWRCVGQLDSHDAMVVTMHYRHSITIDQIAEILDCPPGSIKTVLFRARKKLKQVFTNMGLIGDEK